MSRKKDANKYWIYGEDAALAARFTKYLTKVLYARRASYIRDKMVEVSREISIEDCSGEVDDVYGRLTAPIEEHLFASGLLVQGFLGRSHAERPRNGFKSAKWGLNEYDFSPKIPIFSPVFSLSNFSISFSA